MISSTSNLNMFHLFHLSSSRLNDVIGAMSLAWITSRSALSAHSHRRWRLHGKCQRPVGTSFHCGTVKQIQKHCHLICFSTSVKHFNQNTRTKRRTAPPVTSSFLCNHYWFCIRGRPPFSPNTERSGRPYRKEPKWWLFAGTTLRTSSQFVAVKEACVIYTHTIWSGIPSNQRKPGLTQSRAEIYLQNSWWFEVSKSNTQVWCFCLEAD